MPLHANPLELREVQTSSVTSGLKEVLSILHVPPMRTGFKFILVWKEQTTLLNHHFTA